MHKQDIKNYPAEIPDEFRKYFWDVDWEDLNRNMKRFMPFIVSRIADKGNLQAIAWLKQFLDTTSIAEMVFQSQNISRKTRLFWERYARYVQTSRS